MPADSRNTFFEACRAIAIIGALFFHSGVKLSSDTTLGNLFLYFYTYCLFGTCTVSLFVFLAGYFGTFSYRKNSGIVFLQKRLIRLGIPYLFWSFVFILVGFFFWHQTYGCKYLIRLLLFGQAAVPFYYFIVLFQLVLLTPPLVAWAKKARWLWIPYVISLLFDIGFNYCRFFTGYSLGFGTMILHPLTLCVPWLAVYWSGILCNLYEHEIHHWICRKKKLLFSLTILSYLLFFGVITYFLVDYYYRQVPIPALGQHFIAAFLPTNFLMFVLFFYRHTIIRNRALLLIGNYSYGIFLVHCLFTQTFYEYRGGEWGILQQFPLIQALATIVCVLVCCMITIWISRKVLGKNKAAWIGL